ncbi:MAG: asparagine synthase (glutamine-hydrolyzing) [Bacteroidetes bacterium]|nr:MAG: asparagine synthase (glutamine-hydrolyzing) [Bacteroidota bacterium]
MCRITGFIDFKHKRDYELEATLVRMRDTMTHGGPDDAGTFLDTEKGIALGHRRLSIIDLSATGHQPMQFENLIITYNGEIYNFAEIKKELEKENYKFISTSDTEVILKAYHKWGMEAAQRFRGMWAFAIWDKKEEKLILCRDRVGVKPLYWYQKDGLFMFSSELRAFHQHPDFKKEISEKGMAFFLQYGYISSPYSIFRNTYKLEPGYFLTVNKAGDVKKEKYWELEDAFVQGAEEKEKWNNRNDEEVEQELEKVLSDSFKLRMVSDVPVGVFLSGGFDSTLVTSLLQKDSSIPIKTFTIGFNEEAYNEAKYARKVASHMGTDHTELYCNPKEAFDIFPKLPDIYDEPFADSSAIPTILVSRLARQKVKVSLSADGGDEQFYGYTRYPHVVEKAKNISTGKSSFFKTLNMLQPRMLLDEYGKTTLALTNNTKHWNKYSRWWVEKKGQEMYSWYDIYVKVFQEQEADALGISKALSHLFKFNYPAHFTSEEILMLYDLKTYLPGDLLAKVDRATMSVGLEGRDPFLDHKLVEYSSRLPLHYKYRDGKGKYLLRKILYKYVPQELMERPKQGFTIPIHKWFRNECKDILNQYLNADRIKKEGILKADEVKKLLDSYLNGGEYSFNKLYILLMFQMWREKWFP